MTPRRVVVESCEVSPREQSPQVEADGVERGARAREVALEQEVAELEREKTKLTVLTDRSAELVDNNAELVDQNAALVDQNAALVEENTALTDEVAREENGGKTANYW